MKLSEKQVKDLSDFLRLVDDMGWDYDYFSSSGQETYDKIEKKLLSLSNFLREQG